MTERLDANGAMTLYTYYPDDQLKEIIYPDYTVAYQYSNTNLPTQMVDNLGETSWIYDDLDRLVEQNDPFTRDLTYAYDFVGNLTQLAYPDGNTVSHSYLDNDWLFTTATSDGDNVAFTRNGVGATTYIDRSNHTYSAITYDKVYRPLTVNDQQVGGGNHLIHSFAYTYNEVGHITQEVAHYGWRQPEEVTTLYDYDGLHRLISANDGGDNQTTYAYDEAGNRITQAEQIWAGPGPGYQPETWSYSYNAANQLTQIDIDSPLPPHAVNHEYQYDGNGNRVQRLIDDATGLKEITAYSYDVENRLVGVHNFQQHRNVGGNAGFEVFLPFLGNNTTASAPPNQGTILEYDGNGRRLVKTYYPSNGQSNGKRTEYVFDRLDPVVEYDLWNGQRRNYYRDNAQNLLLFQTFPSNNAPHGTSYFYHYDGEGNIGATTKQQGQSDHAYRYDEYGAVLPEQGNWTAPHNEYTLNQKEFDSNTGLHYFGARHYDATTGTWLTQDTYRGQYNNPASLHRYQYNFNSPQNYLDRYGFVGEGGFWDKAQDLTEIMINDIALGKPVTNNQLVSNLARENYMSTAQTIRAYQRALERELSSSNMDCDRILEIYELLGSFGADLEQFRLEQVTAGSNRENFVDRLQTGLDIAGLVPLVGEPIDAINGLIYLSRGKHGDAALSFVAVVPVIGSAGTGTKLTKKVASSSDEILHYGSELRSLGATEDLSGVVYKRTDLLSGETYVGQAKSLERYDARQLEHARDNLDKLFDFEVLGRANPGQDLDVLEESWIRHLGGPSNQGGSLVNKRYQMNDLRYTDVGGTIPKPTQ